jgi:DNA-directed RNA polymerase subunit RPC12/RpoP
MSVHTLGEAWKLGWRVRVRCLWGTADPQSRRRTIDCNTTADLDMKTLVWTRGEAFPLDQLESRMRCPRCGSRRVTVLFEVPNQPKAAAGRVR